MRRFADWPSRLAAYIAQRRETAFEWGRHDCVTFAAGAVHAITGRSPVVVDWGSQLDAVRALRARGGLAEAVDYVLPRADSPLLAKRGDVVMVEQLGKAWLAVVDAAGWVAPSVDGLVRGPLESASIAWRVGGGACQPR